MQVLIVVTHLLGTGHLRRAMILARAFHAAGHGVTLSSGGTPVEGVAAPGVRLVQLPPLKSDGTNFTTLLTADGTPADPAYLAHRQSALLDCLSVKPDVIITELYPFGRRVLAPEFTALLDRAASLPQRPKILCSIRDILAPPSKPSKADKTQQVIDRYYDGVLVHSDATATPLDVSWPVTHALRAKLHYTGFVAPSAPDAHPTQAGRGEVLVSAGGGAVGQPVFQAALGAAALTPDLTWRILVGGTEPAQMIATLRHAAPDNALVEGARPDFRQMLNHAICSVSLAGYNTAMDLLQTGIPALLIPFDEGGEVEQSLRAQSFAALPGFDVLRSADLTPDLLAQSVMQLTRADRRAPQSVAMTGADDTVRITETLVGAPA